MAKLVEFVLVPTVKVGRGHVFGLLGEADLINRYVKAMSDELDGCSIRHRVSETIFPFEFVLKCGLTVDLKPPQKQAAENTSRVYIGQTEASTIANLLTETLGHWGKCYVSHGHRASKPVVDQGDADLQAGAGGVRLEPFVLNGPNAAVYAQRLELLGRDIGRTIADYCLRGDHGAVKKSQAAEEMRPRLVRQPF